ncbi:MAG: ribonuclease H-like YkuK family protein [Patescibacteria group bacterium]|nr:ribonuclease H-like YkuK family protein [Patescibacteria group bacterium]
MKDILKGDFYNPTVGNLDINQVIEEILSYIKSKPDRFYDIIVGCDSPSDEIPYFPVAVVVLRVGEGGRIFLKKISYKNRKFYSFKERVLEEVLISCELALHFKEELYKKLDNLEKGGNWQFRYIHADVGANGDTKDMIKEVVGLIKGNGFEPKIKPESYVASVVADRYT